MRYIGNKCDGCNVIFKPDDDIVVCPECATPQHRECYDKNNCCVNAHLHSEDFQWQGEEKNATTVESSTLSAPEAEGEPLACPNCGYNNKAGATVCEQCGMKFVMFGINVVENLQKSENGTVVPPHTDSKIPDYKPPFTIGEGEGFDYEQQEAFKSTDPQDVKYYNENDDENIFKGPYPDDDKTLGVRTNTIGAFIRTNADSYIRKFKNAEFRSKGLGFNWAVLFFGPYWFFYRKLIKPGIIFLTIQFCASLLVMPSMNKFLSFSEQLAGVDQNISEEALSQLMTQLEEVMLPLAICGFIVILINIIFAFLANKMYKDYVFSSIEKSSAFSNKSEKIALFTKLGGSSFMYVALAYLGEMLLSNIVNTIIF